MRKSYGCIAGVSTTPENCKLLRAFVFFDFAVANADDALGVRGDVGRVRHEDDRVPLAPHKLSLAYELSAPFSAPCEAASHGPVPGYDRARYESDRECVHLFLLAVYVRDEYLRHRCVVTFVLIH